MYDSTKEGKTEIKPESYQDINARTVDKWVEEGWTWGQAISHEEYLAVGAGVWQLVLTPNKAVPRDWLGELKCRAVLGLASGGGQQMPIFAALGAVCTVLDNSTAQIESEERVAAREGYHINIIKADMTKPLPFPDESFNLIFHPVSNVYVEEVKPIFKECYRILKTGGVLLCGLDNGVNFLVDEEEKSIINRMPFNPLLNPEQRAQLEASDAGIQFSHTLEEQIGGQLEAGFFLTHLYEDSNGEGRLHDLNIATFIATRAVKTCKNPQ